MNKSRLFVGSCFALISTSVCFAVIGAIMGSLKQEFILSNEQVGYIGGAAIWGFTVSIFLLGPLVDALGMKNLMRFAGVCHLAGPLLMIFAGAAGDAAYWMLFFGALVLSLGNGTVEAVCNPLIATIYPEEKTKKLNQFHVWFPGGIVIGGVAAWFIDWIVPAGGAVATWQIKLAVILIPTVIYGLLFFGQKFPATERVQSGVTFGGMMRALLRPLFIILLICMCITASLELGPGRWIPSVLEAGGIAGILVLAYINGLMAILRFFAGPVVHRFSPPGVLVLSAILGGIGLFWFSFATTAVMAVISATVFAVGVCYFWPTMLGVVAERVPRSGALGLALMGGMGMLMVGVVTTPLMGYIADEYLHDRLEMEQTVAVLDRVAETYPLGAQELPPTHREEVMAAVAQVNEVLVQVEQKGELPDVETANAMRAAITNSPGGDLTDPVVDDLQAILGQADNYGGRMSFRYVAPFAVILVVVFGVLYLRDKARGGYKPEQIDAETEKMEEDIADQPRR
jgi:MFS family permease